MIEPVHFCGISPLVAVCGQAIADFPEHCSNAFKDVSCPGCRVKIHDDYLAPAGFPDPPEWTAIPYPLCQVCGKVPGAIICCSSLGPVSFCYCKSCADSGAEPYDVLAGTIAMAGGFEGMAEWLDAVIDPSLLIAAKTREDLAKDVAEAQAEFDSKMGGA